LTIRGILTSKGISHLKHLSRLQTLDMADDRTGRNLHAHDLETLASLSGLRSLDLSGSRLIDDDLKLLEKLSALETLKVENCQIEKEALKALQQALPNCEIAYSEDPLLNALLNHQDDIVAAVEAIAHSIDRSEDGKVLGIEFRHSPISDEGLRELERLPDLQRLSFTYCRKFTDYGLEALGQIENLKNLTLSSTNITNRGLGTVGTLNRLTVLDLTLSEDINDAGMSDLAALKELTRLSLRGTGVSDLGIDELADLTKLQSLDLRGTPVTSEGVNRLKSKLPNCAIEH
jgi:Leucine-rich repeat (LRR) protein